MASSMPSRAIRVEVLTPSTRIVGTIQVSHTGVIGLMNDTTTSLMEVREASMAHLDQPKKLVERFRIMRVVKQRVFAVVLSRPDDVGSVAWTRGGYGEQRDYPVRIMSPVYELDGTFRWSERFDLHAIMVEGTRDFLPLYDAKVVTALLPNFSFDIQALLFNRKQVDALALTTLGTGDLPVD